ncbi:exodeoxyribonuclease VII large subunit [Candidatus Berkelbacteria bacterium]|nr:exodeoxyribonuclease VII large subunit [Candidatus Berkelbacteria bacterium]
MSSKISIPCYTVSEFNLLVNNLLTEQIGEALVRGEVNGYTLRANAWVGFDLKDGTSVLSCFAHRTRIGTVIEDGMEVRILGIPRIYLPYGKYSFNVLAIEPVGSGALHRAYLLLMKKLEAEGLFAQKHKQIIPRFPDSIGLITSSQGAALGDVRRILRERWGGFRLYLFPVKVQGTTTVDEILNAINYFNTHHPVDTLILTRGGGSLEDLQAFNDERLARVIFSSRIPIIAAIGHERDVTIAELVADARAATPSNTAQLAVPDRMTLQAEISHSGIRIKQLFQQKLESKQIFLRSTFAILRRPIQTARVVLEGYERILIAVNPQSVLKRGYSVTTNETSGRVIRSATLALAGSVIRTRVADGSFVSKVQI